MGNRPKSNTHKSVGAENEELGHLVRLLARTAAAEYVQGRVDAESMSRTLNEEGRA